MRGRKPLPTELKLLAGNPGHRPLNTREPKPKVKPKMPKAPSFLNKRAQAEWRRTGQRLFDLGILTELDEVLLSMYCSSFSHWTAANETLEKEGYTILSARSGLKPSPWLAIANSAWKEILKIMIEFGMTPSSRTRVQVNWKPIDQSDSDGRDWFGDAHNN